MIDPIDPKWIMKYCDQLIEYASKLPENSPLRQAALLRVTHVHDLVEAWKERTR